MLWSWDAAREGRGRMVQAAVQPEQQAGLGAAAACHGWLLSPRSAVVRAQDLAPGRRPACRPTAWRRWPRWLTTTLASRRA